MTRLWPVRLQRMLALDLQPEQQLDAMELAVVNPMLFRHLSSLHCPEFERQVLIQGRSGSGRTALLKALCGSFSQRGLAVAFFDCAHYHQNQMIEVLDQPMQVDLLCLDNFDWVMSSSELQQSIINYWQRRYRDQSGSGLVITHSDALPALRIKQDLISRLKAGTSYLLTPLSDQLRIQALHRYAGERQELLSDAAEKYILNRHSRSLGQCIKLLDQAIVLAQAYKRPITVPIIKEVEGWSLG
ncbi:MAG: HdaA/DnaA family protein [Gammaproteobacteria bacterium]